MFGVSVSMVVLLIGCKFWEIPRNGNKLNTDNVTVTQWSNITENRPESIKHFDSVGIEHNKMLAEVYGQLNLYKNSSRRAAAKNSDLSDEEINTIVIRYFSDTGIIRSVESEMSDISHEKYQFLPSTQKYIDKIENLIANKEVELNEVLKGIELIELEADVVIPNVDKVAFYSYTATMRASLAYWSEHIDEWDALRDNSTIKADDDRGWFQDLWRKYRERIAMSAASDAAGAAVGAGIGALIASETGPGAAVGAAIGGRYRWCCIFSTWMANR